MKNGQHYYVLRKAGNAPRFGWTALFIVIVLLVVAMFNSNKATAVSLKAIFGIWPSAWVIPTTLSLMCEGSRIFIMFLDLDFLARFFCTLMNI